MIRVRCDQFSKHWGFLFSQLLTKLIFRFLWNWNDTNYSNVCYTLLGNSHWQMFIRFSKSCLYKKLFLIFNVSRLKLKTSLFYLFCAEFSFWSRKTWSESFIYVWNNQSKKLQIYIFCTLKIWRRSHWLSETVNSWAVNYFSWFSKPFTEKPWLLEFQKIKDFETCSIAGNVKTD